MCRNDEVYSSQLNCMKTCEVQPEFLYVLRLRDYPARLAARGTDTGTIMVTDSSNEKKNRGNAANNLRSAERIITHADWSCFWLSHETLWRSLSTREDHLMKQKKERKNAQNNPIHRKWIIDHVQYEVSTIRI